VDGGKILYPPGPPVKRPFYIQIAGKRVRVPANAVFNVEHQWEGGSSNSPLAGGGLSAIKVERPSVFCEWLDSGPMKEFGHRGPLMARGSIRWMYVIEPGPRLREVGHNALRRARDFTRWQTGKEA